MGGNALTFMSCVCLISDCRTAAGLLSFRSSLACLYEILFAAANLWVSLCFSSSGQMLFVDLWLDLQLKHCAGRSVAGHISFSPWSFFPQ